MSILAATRIKREFKEAMRKDELKECAIKIEIVNDCYTDLRGEIAGPKDTPYEGGKFVLEIKVPDKYPFIPPKVRFATKIWHPNISSENGAICLDILKDNWAAAMNLRTVLLSLQAMLSTADIDEPQDPVVSVQYKENHSVFVQTAKHWTNIYAGGPHKFTDFDDKIRRIMNMGVDEDEARSVLSKENWDFEKASEALSN